MELNDVTMVAKFGVWLKEQRVGLGLSLREASWRSGISQPRLTSIETGTLQVGINSVETTMIAKIYKITADEFLLQANGVQ
ncbi:MAG: helix-turn-helix transcriptional regulator [Bdellovibrionia bacterium]